MANYAYLRVSTERQDVEHQKLGILEYRNRRRIAPLTFVEDTASGSFSWRARALGRLLEQVQAGDVIVAAEVSRLARSTLQVLALLEIAAAKAVSVHIVKGHLVLDGSLQATTTATILGLAAQIEWEFIAARTKEALARRKAQGLPLGRPKGPEARVKLDSYQDLIVAYLHKGVSKRSIARILECSPSTLYAGLRRHRMALRKV
jgi:DNA invertase Pin-like site-specific DNA recombinase